MKNKIMASLILILLIAVSVSAVSANEDINDAISETSDMESELKLSNEYETNIDSTNELAEEPLSANINENSDDGDDELSDVYIEGKPIKINDEEDLVKYFVNESDEYEDGQVFKLNNDYTFNFNETITIKKSFIIEGGKIRGNVDNFFMIESPANDGPSSVTIRNTKFFLDKHDQTILLAKGVEQGINNVLNVAEITLENITIAIANQGATLLNIESTNLNTRLSGALNITGNNLNNINALTFNGIKMTHDGLNETEIYLPANDIIFHENSFIVLNTDGIRTAVDSSVGDSPFTFQLVLVDDGGYAVENKTITFELNGKEYTATTDEKGTATLKLSISKAGIYEIHSQFKGDERYYASNKVTNKITVEKKDSILTVKNVAYKSTASKKLSATFKDRKGNLIKNKKVTFTVNGKTYSATTNSKGVATVKISLNKKGKYTYKAKFAGDGTYAAVTKSAKLTINPVATSLTAKKYSYKKATKTKKLKATLKSGTKVLKNKKVTFKVNGKTYTAKTNSKGIATVKIKLTKKGTFKYTAKFAGDSMYKAISKTNKVVIK